MERNRNSILCGIMWMVISVTAGQEVDPNLMQDIPGWTKIQERHYLYVPYERSWEESLNYCRNWGGWLAEPSGYFLNQEIAGLVPASTDFWTGYRHWKNTPAHQGEWSTGQPAGIENGIWSADGQPQTTADGCAHVRKTDSKNLWHMTSCHRLMTSVCEAVSCPTGTFRCYNGKCRAQTYVCDGKNDCGDGSDEMNCSSSCSFKYTNDIGSLSLNTINGAYPRNLVCSWLIETNVGSQIKVTIDSFSTEPSNDIFELRDGGPTVGTSQLVARISGDNDTAGDYSPYFTSSNFLLILFSSDQADNFAGFTVSWTTNTDSACVGYREYPQKGFTADSVVNSTSPVLSKQTDQKCKKMCSDDDMCTGFAYRDSIRTCFFFRSQPMLQTDASYEMFLKSCPPFTSLSGRGLRPITPTNQLCFTFNAAGFVPSLNNVLTATGMPQDLFTPLFPGNYIGNMEKVYVITSPYKPVSLEVVTSDLCYSDYIEILDGDGPDSPQLYRMTSSDTPLVLLSSGHSLYIYMHLKKHWTCGGVLMKYSYGCNVTLTASQGTIYSPGYGAGSYPPLLSCTWTLYASDPADSISITFDDFDLEDQDDYLSISNSSGIPFDNSGTGSAYQGETFVSTGFIELAMTTDSKGSNRGFSAKFSKGCPNLASDAVNVDPPTANYLDSVTVTCAEGYSFTGPNEGVTSVTLTCLHGGIWDLDVLPSCKQGVCGPPPDVTDGYIVSSDGELGGDITVYNCMNGYVLQENSSIMCQSNNQWETPPSCKSMTCRPLSDVLDQSVNIDYIINDEANLKHGTVANLSCVVNYELYGSASVQCVNGIWDYGDTVPSCEKICCKFPAIPNAVLTPQSNEFYVGENVMVSCQLGYYLEGKDNFLCDTNMDLPECKVQHCAMETLDEHLEADLTAEHPYGAKINVSCKDGYKIAEIDTTEMELTCVEGTGTSGQWNYDPTCMRKTCGTPPPIVGAVYVEEDCGAPPCNFSFTCDEEKKFLREGASAEGDEMVRCGTVYPGLWDFGDLRCTGGQCPSPGFLASAQMIGNSFTWGSTVKYECDREGHEVDPTDTIECVFDQATNNLTWSRDVEELSCKDKKGPDVSCPGTVSVEQLYDAPNYQMPTATDPSGVRTVKISPDNSYPDKAFASAQMVTYKFTDYASNSESCTFLVKLSEILICNNEQTKITLNRAINFPQHYSLSNYISNQEGHTTEITPNATVHTISSKEDIANEGHYEVRSFSNGLEVAKCDIVFSFQVSGCQTWSLHVPNGTVVERSNGVTVTCNPGHYFTEDVSVQSIDISCTTEDDFEREIPLCGSDARDYLPESVKYTVTYEYEYTLTSIPDTSNSNCRLLYAAEIENHRTGLTESFDDMCGDNVSVDSEPIIEDAVRFNGTHLLVTGAFILSPFTLGGNEIDHCLNNITQAFNGQRSSWVTFQDLDVLSCPSATYNPTSISPSREYGCYGARISGKDADGNWICVDCPVGHKYDSTGTCTPCPEGMYGTLDISRDGGATCIPCPPEYPHSRKTGMKSVEECKIPGRCKPGSFSSTGLEPCRLCPKNYTQGAASSRRCNPCPSDKSITTTEGVDSPADCVAATYDIVCRPNGQEACNNNGTCTIVSNTFFCHCSSGWTGRMCEQKVTACKSNPCQNGVSCMSDDPDSYTCDCPDTEAEALQSLSDPNMASKFWGHDCKNKLDLCPENVCGSYGTCYDQASNYRCVCPSNSGYADSSCGTVRNPCEENPCSSNGVCITHGSVHRQCLCNEGYTGLECDIEIDTCANNPCSNGGTCEKGFNDVLCHCPPGYTGKYCELEASCDYPFSSDRMSYEICSDSNTATCNNIANSYTCVCNQGFEGVHCEHSSLPCSSCPCQHGGNCTNSGTTDYVCDCVAPWIGRNCERMTDFCDAVTEPECDCYSTTTGYRCMCPVDRIGDNCEEDYNLCQRTNPCQGNGSTCNFDSETGSTSCDCGEGFTGNKCETRIFSCVGDVCQNGGICSEDAGRMLCKCVQGYTGDRCEIDINDCEGIFCGTNSQCIDGVNMYTCRCIPGKRGENCDKDVTGTGFDSEFDYVIRPTLAYWEDDMVVSFGDGPPELSEFTISLWLRYTHFHTPGTFLTVVGYPDISERMSSSPTFKLIANSQGLTIEENTSGAKKRRKRATSSSEIEFSSRIDDGNWHSIVITWESSSGELSLYSGGIIIGQALLSYNTPLPNSGYLVLGAFDETTGITVPSQSFEGRISKFFMVNQALDDADIDSIEAGTYSPSGLVLNQERNLMLAYFVDYNSELAADVCVADSSVFCPGLYEEALYPSVSCSGDVRVDGAERVSFPTWPSPTFEGTTGELKVNMESGATPLTWGVYGVVVVGTDADGNAAVCTFRVFKTRANCSTINDPLHGLQTCTDLQDENELKRCQISCQNANQKPTGDYMQYYTCGIYSSWDQTDSVLDYIYPSCADAVELKEDVTLSLYATLPDNVVCNTNSALGDGYKAHILNAIQEINRKWQNGVCGSNCNAELSCNNGKLHVQATFPTVETELTSDTTQENQPLSAILLQEIGDHRMFDYTAENRQMVTPELGTLQVTSIPSCLSGYQVSDGSCVKCGPGTYYDDSSRKCIRCAVSMYQSSSGQSSCIDCPTGKTTASTGSTADSYCLNSCFTGQYFTESNGCGNQCPVGFYQDQIGQFYCKYCEVNKTTASTASNSIIQCVLQSSLTTTPTTTQAGAEGAPSVGASTESIEGGVVAAIVLAGILALAIIALILVFCFCKGASKSDSGYTTVPCLADKKQKVTPEEKEKYHVSKYGETNVRFASYRLEDVREKRRAPDRQPIVEAPSDESSSVHEVHHPVFMEKLDGSVKNQHSYISRGRQKHSTPRLEGEYDDDSEGERRVHHKRRTKRKHRRPAELPEPTGPMPKALAPLPHRLRSMPPPDLAIRPLSAMTQPRQPVAPAQYQEFLQASPSRQRRHVDSPEFNDPPPRRVSTPPAVRRSVDLPQYYTQDREELQMRRIQVESDEDLR